MLCVTICISSYKITKQVIYAVVVVVVIFVVSNVLVFQLVTFFLDPFLICVSCLSCSLVCSLQPCGYLLGKG